MLNQTNANNIQLAAEPVKYGSPINITGWGDLEDMPGDFSYKLQIAQLEIVDRNECNKKLGGRVTDKMFCAKSNKTNICSSNGDIGGPSIISNLLYGILITWYDACKQYAGYEVFTDLYNFYFWINMKKLTHPHSNLMMKSNSLVKSSKLIQLLEHIFKCSTTLLQEIVDRHRDGKLRPISWIRILFYCYCVSIGIRILFASIYSNNPEKYEFIGNYQHDQYVNWINTMKNSNNSAMIGYSIIPLVSLPIYFDYLIYVRPNQYVWSLMHQLMVENSRDFFHLNSHLILDYQMNHSTTNAIKSIKSKLKMIHKYELEQY
ncbi:Kallikrein-8 [Blomia tropicalis]|nr:Kallikrein-8 [Blomia tropicalis]